MKHSASGFFSLVLCCEKFDTLHGKAVNTLHQRFSRNIIFTATTLDLKHILSINDTAIPDPQPLWVRISCSPLLIFSRPPLCWFRFLFSSIQFHLLNFRSFFTFFGLHIYDFYGIIIQKMIEYSIYYKQVVPPCQEENVKTRCIFQIEYLQIPLHIVTAR